MVEANQGSESGWTAKVLVLAIIGNQPEHRLVRASVPGWNPNKVVHFRPDVLPEELRDQIAPGTLLTATLNIKARRARDLNLSGFELLPVKPNKKD